MSTTSKWALIFGQRIPAGRRKEYNKRLSKLATVYTYGDVDEMACIVDTWKNGCFEKGDEELSFMEGTFKAMRRFEACAQKMKQFKDFLATKNLCGLCDEYDGLKMWIHTRRPDGTPEYFTEDGFIDESKEEVVVELTDGKIIVHGVQNPDYHHTEYERFYDEQIKPYLRANAYVYRPEED